jgi:isopentenyl-diphosphate Delta-isomerase
MKSCRLLSWAWSKLSTLNPSRRLSLSMRLHNLEIYLKNIDKTQLSLLDERCILVDQQDKRIGAETKKNCHLLANINQGMLHRAFSVFLFDKEKRLLLQQRSERKITYPNHWTNTCCSHPLDIEEELDDRQENIGIKRAAKRRLYYELGINQLDLSSIEYLTRIRYKAENVPKDDIFGESEIDYVLFIYSQKDYNFNINENEVKAIRYVNRQELEKMINEERHANSTDKDRILLTPWFKLISERFLFEWWSKLENIDSIKEHKTIYKLN